MKSFALIFLVLLMFKGMIFSQQKDSKNIKIGLALSGGGAKGFAQIGALKALDDLGMPIHYIGGTSIGSIVGGMYAIGYQPDDIMKLVAKQDWDFVLSDEMIRDYMPFFEKEEMDRYVISLPISGRSISLPSYLIKGQNIAQMLSDLTVGYHDYLDFNQLPIPYFAVATDLATGEEIVLNQGILPDCMRASMAIPAAVSAEEIDGKLLVDGGVSNVFPVDRLKDMGADVVIGIDIQTGLRNKQELKDGRNLIHQLVAIISKERYEKNVDLCDVHIKPDVDGYSISSFSVEAADELYRRGYESVMAIKDTLLSIKSISGRGAERPIYNSVNEDDVFFLRKIEVLNGNAEARTYIKGKLELNEGTFVPFYLIEDGIKKLYASTNYYKVKYRLVGGKEKTLIIDYVEANQSLLNVGLNYNVESQASLLVNGTLKNKLGLGSMLSADIILSRLPVFKVRYTLDKGALPGLEIRGDFRDAAFDLYNEGQLAGFVKGNMSVFQANTHAIFNHRVTIGAGIEMEQYDIESFYYNVPDDEEPLNLSDENFYNYQVFVKLDNRDSKYFPSRGAFLQGYAKVITTDFVTLHNNGPLLIGSLKYSLNKSLSKRLVVSPAIYMRFLWGEETTPFHFSRIGGEDWVETIENQIPFYGMRFAEIQTNEVISSKIEMRYNIFKTHYIHSYFNIGAVSNDFDFINNGRMIIGGGLGYSLNTLVGPINFTITSSSNNDSPITYFSLGYWF